MCNGSIYATVRNMHQLDICNVRYIKRFDVCNGSIYAANLIIFTIEVAETPGARLKISLPCSQKSVTGPYYESHQSIPAFTTHMYSDLS